jgi:protease PrsW
MPTAIVFESISSLPLIAKMAIAFVSGLVPVLVWLWFWEHEDKNPEPKKLVIAVFIGGMISVGVALFAEQFVCIVAGIKACTSTPTSTIIFIWAAIEEIVKYTAAYIIVLSRAENDEPIDSMMYMIMVALGFAALENALFIFNPLNQGLALVAITTGNLRFIGATLLHTIASGTIGLFLALAFYKDVATRRMYIAIGVITAIVLHALFNLSIMATNGSSQVLPLYAVWIAIVVVLLAFEKVKTITKS